MTKNIKFKQIIGVILSLALVLGCLSGCGNTTTEQTESDYYEFIATESGNDSSSNNEKTTTPSGTTDSKTKVSAPSNLKGTKVKMLMWKAPTEAEKKVFQDFKAQTGIEIQYKQATDYGAAYTELISTTLAANEGYDLAAFSYSDFPGRPAEIMQPLNNIKGLDLKETIWNKKMMDAFAINGKYYGVAIDNNNYSEYVCMYYNKTMFENRGVKTPRELYKAGNWNWDTFLSTAQAMTFTDNGTKVYGYANTSFDYYYIWPLVAGTDFITYESSKFTANYSGEALINAAKFYSDLSTKYKVQEDPSAQGTTAFKTGRAAMLSSITYCMYKDSNTQFNTMSDKIDAVPMPSPKGKSTVVPVGAQLWGILKGAKNSEGAAVFLRYFLDPANYNRSSNFINKDLEGTFNELSKLKPSYTYSKGVINYASLAKYGSICDELSLTTSDQVEAKIKSYAGIFNNSVKIANDAIS